ncbi:hypothetical protein [Amycolatopsis alba]|uniref:Calcium-binding protein n=1 Tax=Amycolatopsis alba DSM 44262 TaxID=1125972 RepID=A0A229R926_AMYAL|nr:hypothetical protein [Amycolatopsis alba]OXM43160.1 hypothetical protein CFP75_39865 [Amycolatopsis alba DSM 44262]
MNTTTGRSRFTRHGARWTVLAVAAVALAAGLLVPAATPAWAAGSTCTVNGRSVSGTVISGTAGDDVIECLGGLAASATVNGFAGKDTLDFGGQVAGTVNGGTGGDTITVRPDREDPAPALSGTIRGGGPLLGDLLDGDDDIALIATFGDVFTTAGSYLTGDAGNDTLQFRREAGLAQFSGKVEGGAGADEFQITDDTLVFGTVRGGGGLAGLGDGDDRFPNIVMVGEGGSILGDAGDETITVRENRGTVDGGAGADTITVNERNFGAVTGGSGADTITVNQLNIGTVTGGPGMDTITLIESNFGAVMGGLGEDIIAVRVNVPTHIVGGGPGDDTLTVNQNYGIADGGPGTDTCTVNRGDPPVNCP